MQKSDEQYHAGAERLLVKTGMEASLEILQLVMKHLKDQTTNARSIAANRTASLRFGMYSLEIVWESNDGENASTFG